MGKEQVRHQGDSSAHAHDHPTAATFWKIAAVLFVLTAIEFGIVYLEGAKVLVYSVLAVASVLKFFLVVAYFMHLKFDAKLLSWAFAVGAVLATLITISLKFINLV